MDCLILVDLQNDFMPGGALAVPRGDEVVTVANQLAARSDFVVASQDWHPPGHQSFASQHKGRLPGETIQLHGDPPARASVSVEERSQNGRRLAVMRFLDAAGDRP